MPRQNTTLRVIPSRGVFRWKNGHMSITRFSGAQKEPQFSLNYEISHASRYSWQQWFTVLLGTLEILFEVKKSYSWQTSVFPPKNAPAGNKPKKMLKPNFESIRLEDQIEQEYLFQVPLTNIYCFLRLTECVGWIQNLFSRTPLWLWRRNCAAIGNISLRSRYEKYLRACSSVNIRQRNIFLGN